MTSPQTAALNGEIIMAHRALAAKKTDQVAATEQAAALTAVGGSDEEIDAAERRAEVARRACIRLNNELDALVKTHAEMVARDRAAQAKRLNTQAARELTEIFKDHRALLVKISAHAGTRQDYAVSGLQAELAAVPQLVLMVYDQNTTGGAYGTIRAAHPGLDYAENELERFKRASKSSVAL